MELYHVLNRGVDKRKIFMDSSDYVRFIHDMYAFNSPDRVINTHRICTSESATFAHMLDVRRPTYEQKYDPIVDIHGWCLMGNHYHLLLSERVEGGLSLFLKKLNGGYAKYFNERYTRSGALFQGKTKRILIDSDGYFLYILHYIHLNPLDFLSGAETWRSLTIGVPPDKILEYLASYRWSSYKDYAGIRNFPSLLNTELFNDVYQHNYTKALLKHLQQLDLTSINHLLLERPE